MSDKKHGKLCVLVLTVAIMLTAGCGGGSNTAVPKGEGSLNLRLDLSRVAASFGQGEQYTAVISIQTVAADGSVTTISSVDTPLTATYTAPSLRFTGTASFPTLPAGNNYLCKVSIGAKSGTTVYNGIINIGSIVNIQGGVRSEATVGAVSTLTSLAAMRYAMMSGIDLSAVPQSRISALSAAASAMPASSLTSFTSSFLVSNTYFQSGASYVQAPDALSPAAWPSIPGLLGELDGLLLDALYSVNINVIRLYDQNNNFAHETLLIDIYGENISASPTITLPSGGTASSNLSSSLETLPAGGVQVNGKTYFGKYYFQSTLTTSIGTFADGSYTTAIPVTGGNTLTKVNTLSGSFPTGVSITSPAYNETVSSLTPTFTWTASGAAVYGICLTEGSSGGCSSSSRLYHTFQTSTSFTPASGILSDGRTYTLELTAYSEISNGMRKGIVRQVVFKTPSSGHSASSLNGEYVILGFGALNPTSSPTFEAFTATVTCTPSTCMTDSTNTIVPDPGDYITPDTIYGDVSSDGSVFIFTDIVASSPIPREVDIALRKSSGRTNAALNGTYMFFEIMAESNRTTPSTAYTRVVFNGNGSFTFQDIANSRGDQPASGNGTYSVASDGTLSLENNSGIISEDGSIIALFYNDLDFTSLMIGVKTSSGMSNSSLTGTYNLHELIAGKTVPSLDITVSPIVSDGSGSITTTNYLYDSTGTKSGSTDSYSVASDGLVTIGGTQMYGMLSPNREFLVLADLRTTSSDLYFDMAMKKPY